MVSSQSRSARLVTIAERAHATRSVLGIEVAQARPLTSHLTFEAFQALVRQKVGEVSELETLWSWQQRTGETVGFAGGRLRGLLRWIHRAIEEHGPEAVERMRPPTLVELESLPEAAFTRGVDFDLFTSDRVAARIKAELPEYASWDLLPEAFLALSVQSGGMALEKTAVSPSAISDPLGGLRDYYEGRLTFAPGSKTRVNAGDKTFETTRLSQTLRFFRSALQMPEAAVSNETLEQVVSLSSADRALAANDRRVVVTSAALAKLHRALERDTARTLAVLSNTGVLEDVLVKGIVWPADSLSELLPVIRDRSMLERFWRRRPNIASYRFDDVAEVLDRLISEGIGFPALIHLGALLDHSRAYLERVVPLARTASDLAGVLEACLGVDPSPYLDQSRLRETAPYLGRFFALNPTLRDVQRLDRITGGAASRFGRLRVAVTPAQYLTILRSPFRRVRREKRLDPHSQAALDRMILHDLVIYSDPFFRRLAASPAERDELLAMVHAPLRYIPEEEIQRVTDVLASKDRVT